MFFLNISVFLVVIVLHIFLCLFVVTAAGVDLKKLRSTLNIVQFVFCF